MSRLSLAITAEWKTRVETCANRTKITQHAIAQSAVEAAIEAIERCDYIRPYWREPSIKLVRRGSGFTFTVSNSVQWFSFSFDRLSPFY